MRAFISLLIASSLFLSGCSKLESLRTDVQKSTADVAKQAQAQVGAVQKTVTETQQNIDRKVQKVQNVVNAVDELKKEL